MPESISFDRAAGSYDATRGGEERGERFAAAFAAHLEPGSRVLEVGVGTGAIARPTAQLGHAVLGVDLAVEMIAHASARLGARVALGDAQGLPFASAAVDAIVMVWVLHLVGDPYAVLAEGARVLRPGGRLLVVPADAHEERNDISEIIGGITLRFGRLRDLDDIDTLIRGAGFVSVVKTRTDPFVFDETPEQTARFIEQKVWSVFWDMDERTWEREIVPLLDRLRALPEPDRPRRRAHAHHLLVYERTRS